MPSVSSSKQVGNHSSSTAAKRQPIKTIITRLRSLSVSSGGRSPPSPVVLETKIAKQMAATTPTSSVPLRNNDDILRSMLSAKHSNTTHGVAAGSAGSVSFFLFGSSLTEYFDFDLFGFSSPNNSLCSLKDNSSQHSACLPGFLNANCVVYQGFGGWISKKQLKANFSVHNGKTPVFIIKTFKHSSQTNGGLAKYKADCVREFQIMHRLKNRNITPVYNLCKDDDVSSGTMYYSIILPFYANGDLLAILSNLERVRKKNSNSDDSKKVNNLISTKLVNYFFKQMIAGVCYLHANRVVHCDLKLDNFLIDDNFNLKITDFGMAVCIKDCDKSDIGTIKDEDSDKNSDICLSLNIFPTMKRKDTEGSNICPMIKRKDSESQNNCPMIKRKDSESQNNCPIMKRKDTESSKCEWKFSAYSRQKRTRVYRNINLFKIGTKSYKAPELFFSERQEQMLQDFYSSGDEAEADNGVVKFLDGIFDNLKTLDSWSLGICYLILNLQMFKPWEFSSVSKDINFRIFKKFYTTTDKAFLKALKTDFSKANFGSSKDSGNGLESFLNLEISNFVNDNKITKESRSDEEKFEESEIRNSVSFIKLIPDELKSTIWRLLNVKNSERLLPEDILVNKTEDGSSRSQKDKGGASSGGSGGNVNSNGEFMWVHDVEYFSISEIEKMLGLQCI